MILGLLYAATSLVVVGDSMAHQQQHVTEPMLRECLGVEVTYEATNGLRTDEFSIPATDPSQAVLVVGGTNDIMAGVTEPRDIHRAIWNVRSQLHTYSVYWQTPHIGGMPAENAAWAGALQVWEDIGMLTVVPWGGQLAADATAILGWDGTHVEEQGAAMMGELQCSILKGSE